MLVLLGLNLLSKGLADRGGTVDALGVALIAEVYALALVGSAALAYRIGQRRSAVLLGLLAVVYEADVTLHTETCAVLGGVGASASVAWLGLAVAKIHALSLALRLRADRRAWALVLVLVAGLGALPFALARLEPRGAGALVGAWIFALGALVPRDPEGRIRSLVALDAWGATVLRRSVLAASAILTAGLVLHVGFWTTTLHVDPLHVGLAVFALFVARREEERTVWASVGAALSVAMLAAPHWLPDVALAASAALLLRATSRAYALESHEHEPSEESGPYRVGEGAGPRRVEVYATYTPLDAPTRARLFTGALATAHLGLWTLAYRGGPLPPHDVALDAAVLGFALAMAWKLRARGALGLAGAIVGHALFASGLVPEPRTALGWGAYAITAGFALLAASVGVGYRLSKDEPPRA